MSSNKLSTLKKRNNNLKKLYSGTVWMQWKALSLLLRLENMSYLTRTRCCKTGRCRFTRIRKNLISEIKCILPLLTLRNLHNSASSLLVYVENVFRKVILVS